ncbi:MAG: AAA family ATPase [Ruminococcus sp.]|nr:AAA family ATPase [Ruminococcus sp.]
MKYVLYGLPCSGKTTLINELPLTVINGGEVLENMADGNFSLLSDSEKNKLRIRYACNLSARTDDFISDGHYSFMNEVVFTEADGNLYDVFLYLYCQPDIIKKRLGTSEKNIRFRSLSVEKIRNWQNYEIESLRAECHKRGKDFHVISDISSVELQNFISRIKSGSGSYHLAESITRKIRQIYPNPCEIVICDGDKTIIEQDSFRVFSDNYVTHAFDGNFYTDYQAFKFSNEIKNIKYNNKKISDININYTIYNRIYDKNYIILSSGVSEIWESIAIRFGLERVIADTLISADTKYFVVKMLQESGYTITAYGDSKNDLYMLKQADTGFLYTGKHLSRSLENADTSGIRLLYDKSPYILSELNGNISGDISICKSDSGINGGRLADAHMNLGKILGKNIRKFIPSDDTAVIVLERGGIFFGAGLYIGFGGTFYSYNPKKDILPTITQNKVIITDSVINTGKSVIEIIRRIKSNSPETEIFIATNVIQEKAIELLKEYKIFTVRISANSFVGSRQSEQKNGKGPDTADRLFNYI